MSLTLALSATYCIGASAYFAHKFLTKPKAEKIEIPREEIDRTPDYTLLFENLGLMDGNHGDWIECRGVTIHQNYKLVKFRISDTLSCQDFQKATERLKEKMQVNHLEIYAQGGYMYFRVRNDSLELVPYQFKRTPKHLVRLGLDIDNNEVLWDMRTDPHVLLCGSTGCGKSRLLNSGIDHIYNNLPGCMTYPIDLKRGLELGEWANTRNCIAYAEQLSEVKSVIAAFDTEQERRYQILKEAGFRDYNDYIAAHPKSKLQRAFLIIDEFADLQRLNNSTKNKEYNIVDVIVELACKCRCLGMHIIIATQRPTNSFISSDIKANLSCILGMRAMNELNSRLIIDENGCEELNRAECIGIIGSKKTFFRAFKFEPQTIKDTVQRFARPQEEKAQETPKESKKKAIK